MTMVKESGMLIVVEGIDGAGKTTLASCLGHALEEQGLAVKVLREPGSTHVADKVREILKGGVYCPGEEPEHPAPLAELFLFLAARADLVQKVIKPSIQAGEYVIMDRFIPSTIAYQGLNNPSLEGELHRLCRFATDGLGHPDVVLWLDSDVSQIMKRLIERDRRDLWDDRDVEFFMAVRENYNKQYAQDKYGYRAWIRLDAMLPVEELIFQSLDAIEERREKRSPAVSTALTRNSEYRL